MIPSFTVFGAEVRPYALFMALGAAACMAVFCALTFRRHREFYLENIFAVEMLLIATAAALPAALFFDAVFKAWERGALVFRGATFYGGVLTAVAVWCLLLLLKRRRADALRGATDTRRRPPSGRRRRRSPREKRARPSPTP